MKKWCSLNNFGLLLATFGSILVALSVGMAPCAEFGSYTGGVQTCLDDNGLRKYYHMAYLVHPSLFKLGLIMLISSFPFQLEKKSK